MVNFNTNFNFNAFSLLLILSAVCLFATVSATDDYCSTARTETECTNKGTYCRAVMGQKCTVGEMATPPCSLDFSNENNENCCSSSEDSTHILYLGCMPSNYVCLVQCVEYKKTGALFLVWEGCAFSDSNFTDASKTQECNQCYENVCPMLVTDISWVKYIVEASFFMLFLAFVLAVLPVVWLIFYLFKWRHYFYHRFILKSDYHRLPTNSPGNEMMMMQGIDPSMIEMIQRHPKYQKSLVQPKVREDGMIEIPMSDGSVRVVTADKYQRLYISLMKKRVKEIESARKLNNPSTKNNNTATPSSRGKDDGSSKDDNAEYSTSSSSDGPSSDDELSSEKDPLV